MILLEAFGGGSMTILAYLGIAIILYFMMIRPQTKQKKEAELFISELKQGDKIITSGGIHGRIVSDNGTYFLIDVGANTKIKIEKSSVSVEMSKTLVEAKDKK